MQEALSSGNGSAALRARELCAKAAVVYAQKEVEEAATDMMATAGQGAGVLSVEAVAKHTAEASQTSDPKVPPSSASTRNKTNITGHSQKNGSSGPAASVVHTYFRAFHLVTYISVIYILYIYKYIKYISIYSKLLVVKILKTSRS